MLEIIRHDRLHQNVYVRLSARASQTRARAAITKRWNTRWSNRMNYCWRFVGCELNPHRTVKYSAGGNNPNPHYDSGHLETEFIDFPCLPLFAPFTSLSPEILIKCFFNSIHLKVFVMELAGNVEERKSNQTDSANVDSKVNHSECFGAECESREGRLRVVRNFSILFDGVLNLKLF